MVSKYEKRVPHKLNVKHRIQRVYNPTSVLSGQNPEDFLVKVITVDQKWILYENVQRKGWKKMAPITICIQKRICQHFVG